MFGSLRTRRGLKHGTTGGNRHDADGRASTGATQSAVEKNENENENDSENACGA